MDEYLIQGSTLSDIADAIREKTGDDALMTPAEMVEAIGSISGGGGMTLLAEYVVSESGVNGMRINYTPEMSDYDLFCMEVDGSCIGGAAYICPQLNSTDNRGYYLSSSANTHFLRRYFAVPIYNAQSSAISGYVIPISMGQPVGGASITGSISYFYVRTYYQNTTFSINTAFRIYGIKLG